MTEAANFVSDAIVDGPSCSRCGAVMVKEFVHEGNCSEVPVGGTCPCGGEMEWVCLSCFASAPAEQKRERELWRVGTSVPINVYEGERPVCQCHTAIDARRIVRAMNVEEKLAARLRTAQHALRSYECGNASPDLAKEVADSIEELLTP